MSRENVEIIKASFGAFEREGLEGLAGYWDEAIDWRAIEGAPDDRGPMHGKDAMRAYAQDWLDTFDDFKLEPLEFTDLGDDRVLVVQQFSGRAKQSGMDVPAQVYAVLYTVRDGRIVRGREYMTKEQAREAAGLPA